MDDHPASATPYTPIEVIAKTNISPMPVLETMKSGTPEPCKVGRTEGNQRNGGQAQSQRQERRQDVEKLIRTRRREIFFEQEFHAVGQRLQQSVRANFSTAPIAIGCGRSALRSNQVRYASAVMTINNSSAILTSDTTRTGWLGDEIHGVSLASFVDVSLEQ